LTQARRSLFGSYYSYKYNGKELQETGMYDYGARMLMPDLGRWSVMDAMSEKYSAWSPYNYAINNPVMVIDPDGNDAMFASGEAAQAAFKAYVATMSTSTESSGGNIFTGFGRSFGEDPNDPKPGFWGKVSNWWGSLFGKSKKAAIGVVSVGAATFEGFAPPVEFGRIIARMAGYARLGVWGLPLMLNGDSSFSANSKPINGAIDIPATTTTDESEPEQRITLYRGVSSNAGIAYDEALLGMATPNGFRLSFKGIPHSNMGSHAAGDNNSIWTSWTPMKDVATRFALGRSKSGGVLLTKTFTIGQAIPNTSFMAKEYYADEYEYLVPGIVIGAQVTPIKK